MKKNQDKFLDIILKYKAALPDRIVEIEQLFLLFLSDSNFNTLQKLRFKIHDIEGSAGIFGYLKISSISKQINELLPSIDSYSPIDKVATQQIKELLNELKLINLDVDNSYLKK